MTPRMFARRLEKMADSVEELCQELAEESLELINAGFQEAIDPRGVGWAPRRGRRTNPLLNDTGTLKENFRIFAVHKEGFGIINDTPYGGFHQGGTVKLPKRRMVPGSGEGLGRWAEPLQKVAREWIRGKLEK